MSFNCNNCLKILFAGFLILLYGCSDKKRESPVHVDINAPVANSQTILVERNQDKNITLRATDINDDNLTYIIQTTTRYGVLSGTAPNLIYSPDTEYVGDDSFTFIVNDATLDSNIATVNITVSRASYIKKTMQILSYDKNGELRTDLDLVDKFTYRDDGYHQKGTTPIYTNNVGTVSDYLSGLMWQDNEIISNKTWSEASSYCSSLELGGFNDWRVPSRVELIDIIDYTKQSPSPAIPSEFQYTRNGLYWTSNTYIAYTNDAYIVSFDAGSVLRIPKIGTANVRCVRQE